MNETTPPIYHRRESDRNLETIAASLRTNAFFLLQAAREGSLRKLTEEARTVSRYLQLLADQLHPRKVTHEQ